MQSMEQLRRGEPPPDRSAWAENCFSCLPAESGEVEGILTDGRGSPIAREALLAILKQERERTSTLMAQWLEQQRRLYEEQTSQQERLLHGLLEVQRRTIQDLSGNLSTAETGGDAPGEGSFNPRIRTALPSQNKSGNAPKQHSTGTGAQEILEKGEANAAVAQEAEGRVGATSLDDDLEHEVEQKGRAASQDSGLEGKVAELQTWESVIHWWKRSSGLHTVEKWVSNYHKHPAGWGALLMIQGVPEVTGRLRSKVENYAIYSALFLSMSIALLADKPSSVDTTCSAEDYTGVDWWACHLQLRLYFYGFGIGTAAHMLSIMLAMSFVNALNEAARDSDVYRMFARGKGFYATVRCQYAFRIGCVADLLAVATATTYHIGWEAVAGTVVLAAVTLVQAKRTANLLFSTASIVDYWREELGGKPDKDDPYDLQIPLGVFKETVRVNSKFFSQPKDGPEGTGSADSALWEPLQRAVSGGEPHSGATKSGTGALMQGQQQQQQQQQAHAAAVAAIF